MTFTRNDVEAERDSLGQRFHLLQGVFDNAQSLIAVKSPEGRYLLVNGRLTQWLGRAAEKVCGLTDAELFPGPVARQLNAVDAQVLNGSGQVQMEETLPGPDGVDCTFLSYRFPIHDEAGRLCALGQVLTDISRRKLAEERLEKSEARYRAFIANSSEAIWCYEMRVPVPVDAPIEQQVRAMADGARLSECNRVLARMMGAEKPVDLLGSHLRDIGSRNFLFDLYQFVEQGYQLVDHEIFRKDERGRQLCYQISCVGGVENRRLVRVWGTTKDVTARRRYQDRLEHQATHDGLTQLPNRVKLYKEMETWLKNRRDRRGALLLIDLDRFKEINDTLGHQVGDLLLKEIGPRLEMEIAELPGLVARLGGDEFAIFLEDIRDEQQVRELAYRVLDTLRNQFRVEDFSTELSASIGISLAPSQAEDISTLLRYADVAMYRAKTEMMGLALYDAEYDPHSPKRLALMGELGQAIREGQLVLYYQPKVDLASQALCGFEALVRWQHPELGLVPPGEFIPIAENTSLVHPLTAWVLEQSVTQCRRWHDQGLRVRVAVNLSARNLLDEHIPEQVDRLLHQQRLPPEFLELEITESSIMTDPPRAMRVLERLHQLGVWLAIDDFGTGYSSLAYLKRMPVQTLKIDYSFVRHMLDDEQDGIIVNSTVHLAHNLGLRVVAEGVEKPELLEKLVAMGCNQAQGYHIARPMPPDELQQWLVSSPWAKRSC